MAGVTGRAAGLLVMTVLLAGCAAHSETPAAPRAPVTSPSATPDTSPSTAPNALRVVGLGDSVMAGTNCGCSGLVEEYADALARRTGRPVHADNLGDDGAVTDDVLSDLTSDRRTRSLAARADVVVVTIGANDLIPQLQTWRASGCPRHCFRTAAREVGRNLSRVLGTLTAARGGRSDHVLVTDYWNVFRDGQVALDSDGRAERSWSVRVTAAANTAICRAAQAARAVCVDLVRPFKGSGDRDPTPLLADDGDHPNAAGMKAIVAALMRATPDDL